MASSSLSSSGANSGSGPTPSSALHSADWPRYVSLTERYRFMPVAAGMSLPMMTFSFRPSSSSDLPAIAASVSTRVVSWNEAADRKLSVASDAFVMPRRTEWPTAGSPPAAITRSFSSS